MEAAPAAVSHARGTTPLPRVCGAAGAHGPAAEYIAAGEARRERREDQ
jgi:hypothetical protein